MPSHPHQPTPHDNYRARGHNQHSSTIIGGDGIYDGGVHIPAEGGLILVDFNDIYCFDPVAIEDELRDCERATQL